MRVEGVDDADAAERLRRRDALRASRQARRRRRRISRRRSHRLPVVGVDGTDYGNVDAVEHYPASDMLVVNNRMVPMVHAIVRNIDIAAKRIIVDPPAGLLDDDDTIV